MQDQPSNRSPASLRRGSTHKGRSSWLSRRPHPPAGLRFGNDYCTVSRFHRIESERDLRLAILMPPFTVQVHSPNFTARFSAVRLNSNLPGSVCPVVLSEHPVAARSTRESDVTSMVHNGLCKQMPPRDGSSNEYGAFARQAQPQRNASPLRRMRGRAARHGDFRIGRRTSCACIFAGHPRKATLLWASQDLVRRAHRPSDRRDARPRVLGRSALPRMRGRFPKSQVFWSVHVRDGANQSGRAVDDVLILPSVRYRLQTRV